MTTFYRKFIILFIAAFGLMTLPLHAQQAEKETEEPFIQQGKVLTGFSLGFTNASEDYSDPQLGDEFTRLSINLNGLYFVSDHFGVGPLVGYRFNYTGEPQGGNDIRRSNFIFGAKAGWFTSANEFFNTSSLGRAQFFVDAGVSWLRSQSKIGDIQIDPDYLFGYQIGTGFLFPVGEQIAVETRLGFQSRMEEMLIGPAEREWMSDLALSVGFKVTL